MKELIVDQSDWGHIRLTGADRATFLQGMCCADVQALTPGQWRRAAMLNPKGRVVSIFDIVCREDDLVLICQPDLTDRTIEALDHHAIMDDVEFEAIDLPVHRIWGEPATVWDAPPVLAPPPGPPAPADEVEVRRIEAGMLTYGADVTEDHFPFESPLVRTIDYEKGCYLGQEPVYRVYSKGQANKTMRGLALEGDTPAAPGATVTHPDRPKAGTVTSSVVSPTFGPIALAYLHRSVWEPGGTVTVDGRPAKVVELPFGS